MDYQPDHQSKQQVQPKLIVYGHAYCPQARFMAATLARHQIEHEWRDVSEGQPDYQTELKQLAGGNLSVPTVIFPDGSVIVEAWPGQVLKKLGLQKPNLFERLLMWLRGER